MHVPGHVHRKLGAETSFQQRRRSRWVARSLRQVSQRLRDCPLRHVRDRCRRIRGFALRLTDHQKERLRELGYSIGRCDTTALELQNKGLAVTGHGRFGSWARITAEGRQHLARMASRGGRAAPQQVSGPCSKPDSTSPGSDARPAGTADPAGSLLGARSAPSRRNAASKRSGTAMPRSTSPTAPSEAAASGGTSSMAATSRSSERLPLPSRTRAASASPRRGKPASPPPSKSRKR